VARAHAARAGAAPRFVDAVVDRAVNAMACAVAAPHTTRAAPGVQAARTRAIAAAVKSGPESLTDQQKLFFLGDPTALAQLHEQVSTSPAAHPSWFAARAADSTGLREAS
jgi:membrane glycosyltransferase